SSDNFELSNRYISFSSDGQHLIEVSANTMEVAKWSIPDGTLADSYVLDYEKSTELYLSTDGNFTAFFENDKLKISDNFEKALFKEFSIPNHGKISLVKFSRSNDKFIYGDLSDTLRIVDIANGDVVYSRKGNFYSVNYNSYLDPNFTLSADFNYIGIGSKIYEVASDTIIREMEYYRTKPGNEPRFFLKHINPAEDIYSYFFTATGGCGWGMPTTFIVVANVKNDGISETVSSTIPRFSTAFVDPNNLGSDIVLKHSYDGGLLAAGRDSSEFKNDDSSDNNSALYEIFDTKTSENIGSVNFKPDFSPDNKNIIRLENGAIVVYDFFANPTGKIIKPEDMTIVSYDVVDEQLLLLEHLISYGIYDYLNDKMLFACNCSEPVLIEKGKKYLCKSDNHIEIYDTYSGEKTDDYEFQNIKVPEGYEILTQSDDYSTVVFASSHNTKQTPKMIVYDLIKDEVKYNNDEFFLRHPEYRSRFQLNPNNKVLIERYYDFMGDRLQDYVIFYNAETGEKICSYACSKNKYTISDNFEYFSDYDCPYGFKHNRLCEEVIYLAVEESYSQEAQSAKTFPNPAKDEIRIELPEQLFGKTLTLTISDMLGHRIQSYTDVMNSVDGLSVDVSGLNTGIYLLTAEADGKIVRSRFVVLR
ncbi:MAG: T9SS type A sorting domain-containing protein, partial [Candidatus Kapabacteria bacterium]|nr:T9SS type A sorting domain-containing protein [Candidatus Kapabacteria bacterium]